MIAQSSSGEYQLLLMEVCQKGMCCDQPDHHCPVLVLHGIPVEQRVEVVRSLDDTEAQELYKRCLTCRVQKLRAC